MNCNLPRGRTKGVIAWGFALAEQSADPQADVLASPVRRTDRNEPAIGTWDRTANQYQVLFAVNANNVQVEHRHALSAVLARHADAFFRPAPAAVAGVRGNAAVLAKALLNPVAFT